MRTQEERQQGYLCHQLSRAGSVLYLTQLSAHIRWQALGAIRFQACRCLLRWSGRRTAGVHACHIPGAQRRHRQLPSAQTRSTAVWRLRQITCM